MSDVPYVFANPDLAHARVNDVVAKIARVSLKDTTRVLKALRLLAEFTNDPAGDILDGSLSTVKPGDLEADACVRAFELIETVLGPDAVALVRHREDD